MAFLADVLLAGGAIAAAIYCMVLSRRLARFGRLDDGVGGAIANLSAQVDGMTHILEEARKAARESALSLDAKTNRAEVSAERLEILLASLHDLPAEGGSSSARRLRVARQRPSRDMVAAE